MAADPEVIEAETRELALRPTLAPTTLFGTDDPVVFVAKASKVATALADVIDKQHLYSVINSKKFVGVEGWTTVGSMVGVFPVLRWTRQVEVDGKSGWEARVEAVTLSGEVVGAAEAMCLKGESSNWTVRSNDNAIRSMAQTRATSKALRQPLDFIVRMAGYAATPAEEMVADRNEQDESPAAEGQQRQPAGISPAAAARAEKVMQERRTAGKGAFSKESAAAITEALDFKEAEPGSPASLYEDVVALGILLKVEEIKAFGQDPDAFDRNALREQALEELTRRSMKKYGVGLDKLTDAQLKQVEAALAKNLEAGG